MTPMVIGIIIFSVLLITIAIGVPVAFALGSVSVFAILVFIGDPAASLPALAQISWSTAAHFTLCCVPMFILMGEIVNTSGMSRGLYEFTSKWLSFLPGGLAIASCIACGIFGAISGSSVATAATIGMIAVPEMTRRGYSEKLAMGTTAAGGALGILIPPSIPLIVYGVITETSIGRLFAAGAIPGIVQTFIFSVGILIMAILYPQNAPREKGVLWEERFKSLKGIWPALVLVVAVLGSIYSGVATPSESAAIGCFTAILIARFYYKSLTAKTLHAAVMKAIKTSAMIGMIIVGALLFGYVISALDVPQTIVASMSNAELSRWEVLILVNVLFFFLGMFLEVISIMVITAPVIVPIIVAFGWDPIWFAIVMTINMELALITPPVGLNLYVLKGLFKETSLLTIIRGIIPFIFLDIFVLVIIILIPSLSLWLPDILYGT